MTLLTDSTKIYLDYAATTPVDPRVLETMLPYFSDIYGNSSSVHTFGQDSENALESGRDSVAAVLNCRPIEVIFTSCGSESDNMALRGAAFAARDTRQANHILISPVEHHAVTNTARQLESLHNFELEILPVDEYGLVDPAEVKGRIRSDTAIVSIIYANNEIGTINNISAIGGICRESNVPFHTDAVQAAAYLSVDTKALNVDLLAIGAHKFYGPKGIGALYVRQGTPIYPIMTGGSQEYGLRAGTHNIPYIVGLAQALEYADIEREERVSHLLPLRDYLVGRVLENIQGSYLTGHPNLRMPNHASFVFEEVDGNALIMMLDIEGFACSSGSACKTGDPEPSSVLLATGMVKDLATGSLRVTLGTKTTAEQIEIFLDILPNVIERVRQESS